MSNKFKLLRFIVTLFLAVGLFSVPALAEDAVETITVTVRVESGAIEDEGTLLPPAEAVLEVNKLLSSWQATPLEALEAVTGGDIEITESDYGSFLSGILGVSDESGAYSWMYAVNNEIPETGVDSYMLSDGDEVVFYFISWENADYAYFTPGSLTVDEGESFTLNLTGVDFTDGEYPVEGAMLIIESDAPITRELNYTDADGNAELSFFAAGEYLISAALQNDAGIAAISRPYCVVTVEEDAEPPMEPSGGTADALPAEPSGDTVDTLPAEPSDDTVDALPAEPAETTTDSAIKETPDALDGGEPQLLPEIVPMPMPTAPITYDDTAKTLTVYGKDIDITGLQVIFDEDESELYLPLRAVAETLGATVHWDAATTAVIISTESGETVTFNATDDLAANKIRFIENHVYAPSLFIIDTFGGK